MNLTHLTEISSDTTLFPLLQVALMLFVIFAVFKNHFHKTEDLGGVSPKIERGETTMGYFYGTYTAISALLVGICLVVSTSHRVFWAILDTLLVAYVCLINQWFRNKLVGWTMKLKIEKRGRSA